jgi:hypothetical protein
MMLVFYFTSPRLTKYKAAVKANIEENFKAGGQRDAVQVLCNRYAADLDVVVAGAAAAVDVAAAAVVVVVRRSAVSCLLCIMGLQAYRGPFDDALLKSPLQPVAAFLLFGCIGYRLVTRGVCASVSCSTPAAA